MSFAVVGADYPNKRGPGRRFEIALCAPGDLILIAPEPKNPKDPHAIAVFSERGVQLGYLTAERAPWIGGMLSSGRDIAAIFQEPTKYGAVIRIAFDGEAPTLPAARPPASSADDSGFWPDEVPPDE